MKKILVILFVIIPSIKAVYADKWGAPIEKDYFSANGKFVAHITPAKYLKKGKPSLEVFEMKKNTEKVPLWQCKLGNKVAPVEVYVSNDGRYIVTTNEWYKVGYGDYVAAFYSENGLIKNYSMEEILHLHSDISNLELFRLIPHSVSSRWWDRDSIKFFDTCTGKSYFCVWLHLFDRWVAWNPANGEEVKVDEGMAKKWNNKARSWAIRQIEKKPDSNTPYKFLGKLKNPDDRPLIEALLSDENFSRFTRTSQAKTPQGDKPVYHLIRYTAASQKRLLAEQILAHWDQRPTDKRISSRQPFYYLGKVEGVVILPKTDNPKEGTLWIYLVPNTVTKDQWRRKSPTHRLVASFMDYSFKNFDLEYTEEFPFAITAITPGEYWVKALLDKTKPLSKRYNKTCLPHQGDYQSLDSLIITVKAGETLENITIDCTHKVTNGID